MRIFTIAAAAAALMAGPVLAQTSANPNAGENAAIKSPHSGGLASKGANSFTQGQAIQHMEHAGYSDVSGLSQDKDGLWHGTGVKDGKTYGLSLDFKGNVNAE